jgi:hypothetical protein
MRNLWLTEWSGGSHKPLWNAGSARYNANWEQTEGRLT